MDNAEEQAVGRRAMLAGGVAAAAAAVLARPEGARAGHNTDIPYDSQTTMHLDVTNTTAGSTRISSNISGTAAFVGLNNYPVGISRPDGILGRTGYTTSNCAGVAGSCEAGSGGIGVLGTSNARDGTGVFGFAGSSVPSQQQPRGTGVYGMGPEQGVVGKPTVDTATGVRGEAARGTGVRGETTSGVAVLGVAGAAGIAGRFTGRTVVEGPLDVAGVASLDGLEVRGAAALDTLDVAGAVRAASVEVAGAARAATLEVSGQVGAASLQVAGQAKAAALEVGGAASADKLALPKTSGVLTLGRAASSVSASGIALSPGSLVIAVLQQRRRNLFVVAAVPSVARGRVTVHFNRRAPKGTKVAWMVIN